jgi:hypothetical protein
MEILISNRMPILSMFFITILIAIACSYNNLQIGYLASAYISHIFFFLFFLTEAFGAMSKKRHVAWRVAARIILFITALAIINTTLYFIIAISNH